MIAEKIRHKQRKTSKQDKCVFKWQFNYIRFGKSKDDAAGNEQLCTSDNLVCFFLSRRKQLWKCIKDYFQVDLLCRKSFSFVIYLQIKCIISQIYVFNSMKNILKNSRLLSVPCRLPLFYPFWILQISFHFIIYHCQSGHDLSRYSSFLTTL